MVSELAAALRRSKWHEGMNIPVTDPARVRILRHASDAFLTFGFDNLTMAKLAEVCGLSRRGLYHHFKNKEEVFRALLRMTNGEDLERGDTAAQAALVRGANAVEIIGDWLDARFGFRRRALGASPVGREVNDAAFRVAADVMIEVSYETNRRLAQLVTQLAQKGQIRLRPGVDAEKIGRMLGDGARGVNQSRPPIPNNLIGQHYRDIVEAILFGAVQLR